MHSRKQTLLKKALSIYAPVLVSRFRWELSVQESLNRIFPEDIFAGSPKIDALSDSGRFAEIGFEPTEVKEFERNGALMARFFFVTDPDGYKIEVLERHGRYV